MREVTEKVAREGECVESEAVSIDGQSQRPSFKRARCC